MKDSTQTIAAISTAPGEGGISVIRISGPASLAVADKIFKCRPPAPSKRNAPAVIYGHVISGNTIIDESLLLIMRAPHSYTREDVVEFQCHGGSISAKRILRAILNENVALAGPGEFTKRAFLNGRIDLLQAEAVLDIIRSQSDRGAAMAVEQLEGSLSNLFNATYVILLDACADLEASLDFLDDELPDSLIPSVISALQKALQNIGDALSSWDEGHLVRDGALVVISGPPNVGKSTLLNAMLGKDRVIVSPIPGTTRDVIEESLIIDGIPIRLADTAGLRATECAIEHEGVRRARMQISNADINICVLDASQPLAENEHTMLNLLDANKTIIALNKSDLGMATDTGFFKKHDHVYTQAINGKGVKDIKSLIKIKLAGSHGLSHRFAISERHRAILVVCQEQINAAEKLLLSLDEQCIVLAVSRIKTAIEQLAQATGKSYSSDLLELIFKKFCIGK